MEQFVIESIKNILKQNKVPSVALIKGNLSQSVPMPIIISVLGRYKSDPGNFKIGEAESKPMPTADTSSQSQLDRIERKLDQLLNLLQNTKKTGDV